MIITTKELRIERKEVLAVFGLLFQFFFFVFDRVLLLIRFSLMLDEYTFLPSCVGQGPMEGFQTSLRKKRLGYPCLNRHIQRGG